MVPRFPPCIRQFSHSGIFVVDFTFLSLKPMDSLAALRIAHTPVFPSTVLVGPPGRVTADPPPASAPPLHVWEEGDAFTY